MATIILGLCCLSSMLGGGYVAYDMMKIAEREKLYEDTEGLHMFSECNYLGERVIQVAGERLPDAENDTTLQVQDGFKSFILTDGYKLDAYHSDNLKGDMITYTGPKNDRCVDKEIKSFRFYKA
jgi:hypothetical protein